MIQNRKTLISLLLLLAALLALGSVGALAAGSEPAADGVETETQATAQPELPDENAEETSLDGAPVMHTVAFLGAGGTSLGQQAVADGTSPVSLPADAAGEVAHWLCIETNTYYTAAELLALPITADLSFRNAGVKVSYYKDKAKTELLGTEYVASGAAPTGLAKSDVTNWLDINDKFVVLSRLSLTADTELFAWYTPGLNTAHIAYINGYTATTFAPNSNLTRAQAAVILYRLLLNQSMGPFEANFSDVSSTASYATAVKTLASYGIITGYTDGTFRPKANITRGDFVLMISRLFTLESAEWNFEPEYANRYYADAVAVAANKGWVNGYKEGEGYSFRPRNNITRAEAVTIINRVLGRTPDKTAIDAIGHRIFTDVDNSNNWAFYQIMEAASGEGYTLSPISSLSVGLQTINNKLYYVDETKTFKVFDTGLQKAGDKSIYVTAKAAGVTKYAGGLYTLPDKNGKLYIIEDDGTVRTEPASGNDTRTTDYGAYMYYIQEDGSLLRNGYYGHLYFGENGAYTSGSDNLDSMVYSFAKKILESSKTQERKLYAAYVAIRDCTPSREGYKRYANYGTWTQQYCAEIFLKNGAGSCAEYACAMVYVAQRIGYDCYIDWGKLKTGADHVWELVNWPNGKTYIMDVEQEWGFLYDYYGSGVKHDCYLMDWKDGAYLKYGNRYGDPSTNVWSPYYSSN